MTNNKHNDGTRISVADKKNGCCLQTGKEEKEEQGRGKRRLGGGWSGYRRAGAEKKQERLEEL